ncbi:MAG: AtpZ/AtpI family protein [Actinobacteria bacterium]|nr:AtpZ/AtpI family protein [Actinomycetota bacterium]
MANRDQNFRRELWRDADTGWTMTVELLTAVGVWGGIGWLLDRWLGTGPWILVAGLVLGAVLGTYVVFLRAERQGKAEEAKRSRL